MFWVCIGCGSVCGIGQAAQAMACASPFMLVDCDGRMIASGDKVTAAKPPKVAKVGKIMSHSWHTTRSRRTMNCKFLFCEAYHRITKANESSAMLT